MGARNLGSVFDFADVFDSLWGSSKTDGAGELATLSLREVGETEGTDADGVEMWSQGCLAYRPKKPDAAGMCQALVTKVGGRDIVVATQDARAIEATGALNPGDAAFCSPTGRGSLRCNDDGSVSLMQRGDAGDCGIKLDGKTGKIAIFTPDVIVNIGPDGFFVTTKQGEQIQLGGGFFVAKADAAAHLNAGGVLLGPAPATPLTFAPVSGVAHPAPYILV